MVLKKEIIKTQSSSSDVSDRGPEYRQMLVGAIHQCAVKFPEVRWLEQGRPRLGAGQAAGGGGPQSGHSQQAGGHL
jgi:hypothetical protein